LFYNQELTPFLQFSTNLATPPTPKSILLFGGRGSREGSKVWVDAERGLRDWRDKKGVTA
jgi:hypothetical protein